MCLGELYVSKLPCKHRWVQMVEACQPGVNLSNCKRKLQLRGWEKRVDVCPWCADDEQALDEVTRREQYSLIGSDRNPIPVNLEGNSGSGHSRQLSASTVLSASSWGTMSSDSLPASLPGPPPPVTAPFTPSRHPQLERDARRHRNVDMILPEAQRVMVGRLTNPFSSPLPPVPASPLSSTADAPVVDNADLLRQQAQRTATPRPTKQQRLKGGLKKLACGMWH
ncbi:MAG: hypothetical protein M1826_002882 [Phylliscum demangeonii]|nr:MAG: hypothetical protein M1826_002882 [Phylliscum demangeonii]